MFYAFTRLRKDRRHQKHGNATPPPGREPPPRRALGLRRRAHRRKSHRKAVLPVSVKDPTRECFLSIPTVVGVQGAETVLEIRPHLNYAEAQKYDATADTLEHMCAQLPPVGPMTRTDALDAGAARKEAYEEAA